MTYCIFGTTGYNVLDLDFWHVADDDFSQMSHTQFQSARLKKHPKQTRPVTLVIRDTYLCGEIMPRNNE